MVVSHQDTFMVVSHWDTFMVVSHQDIFTVISHYNNFNFMRAVFHWGDPAGAVRESPSPGPTFCADSYFSIRSTPVLQQQVKIPVILPKVEVAGYSLTHMHPPKMALNEVTL